MLSGFESLGGSHKPNAYCYSRLPLTKPVVRRAWSVLSLGAGAFMVPLSVPNVFHRGPLMPADVWLYRGVVVRSRWPIHSLTIIGAGPEAVRGYRAALS